jgi:hypothetical protein
VAAVRGMPTDEFADHTRANTRCLYRLPSGEVDP